MIAFGRRAVAMVTMMAMISLSGVQSTALHAYPPDLNTIYLDISYHAPCGTIKNRSTRREVMAQSGSYVESGVLLVTTMRSLLYD